MTHGGPFRRWQVVAQELTTEANPERVLELSNELTRALDEQELGSRWRGHMADNHPYPDGNHQSSNYEKLLMMPWP